MPDQKSRLVGPIPAVDHVQCETMITPAYSFMSFGKPAPARCPNSPVVIATEAEPGEDGQTGSMSLCAECLTVFVGRNDPGFAVFSPVVRKP